MEIDDLDRDFDRALARNLDADDQGMIVPVHDGMQYVGGATTTPPGMIRLTRAMLDGCKTDRGGYTHATQRALGIEPPGKRGWVASLVGKLITLDQFEDAVDAAAGRGQVDGMSYEDWAHEAYGDDPYTLQYVLDSVRDDD